jgi:hypothetical protein
MLNFVRFLWNTAFCGAFFLLWMSAGLVWRFLSDASIAEAPFGEMIGLLALSVSASSVALTIYQGGKVG